MVPWSNGRLLVWDATCVDTLPLPIYPAHPLKYVQQQARWSRTRTISTVNSHLMHTTLFTPVAFEISGVCGPRSMSFLTDLGRRIVNTAGDKSSLEFHTFCKSFLFPFRGGMLASSLGALPPTPPLQWLL